MLSHFRFIFASRRYIVANVLLTGSEGFVGRQFQRYFKETGDKVTRIDIKSNMDCRDFFKKNNAQYDLVVHLAAVVGGRMTIEGDPLRVATDLAIDSDMFNWAVNTGQPHVVYYSSSAAYPTNMQSGRYPHRLREAWINVDHVQTPDLSYGWSKLTGELLAKYAEEKGVNVHIFRPFSGYGEDQDLDYPFPSFIKRIKDREDPFEIWGDGNQVRDFIHIEDIVNATMKAVELNVLGPINLGWGRPTSFTQLANMAFDIAEFHPKIHYLTDKPVGVMYRCSENAKMLEFYKPKITLEEGIERALRGV